MPKKGLKPSVIRQKNGIEQIGNKQKTGNKNHLPKNH
jgi:hypothetical protein